MHDKMSTSSQNNGKKSSNSSIANTPSSTPLTNIANGNAQGNMQNSPPPNNNAPKYGTLVPNRIFVGGISANTTEGELMQLFSNYGTVKAAKIIQDRAGVSKGYGFITFESEDDAKRPLREAENIVLRERKLNIAPAIKKQPFSRAFDASSPSAVAAGNAAQFFFPPGATVPYFQGGVAYYPQPAPAAPGDPNAQQPVYQPPPVYPAQTGPPQAATYPSMMFPTQTIYMPQQYPMPMPFDYNYYQSNGAPPGAQYMVGGQGGPGGTAQCAPMPPSSSPPRPPCYNQQMPAYNPADPMFYNLPVYGAAMEGPPVYSEAFDLGTAGPYTEDYTNMEAPLQQDIESSAIGTGLATTSSATNITHIPPPPISSLPHPLPQPPAPHHPNIVAAYDRNANKTSSPHENNVRLEDIPTTRNSTTPVVSLLTIDQQQEKDYLSMQGGRRRKPPTQNNHVQHVYPSNGYMNPFQVNFNQTPPSFPPYGTNIYQNGPATFNNYRRMNGYDNRANRYNKRRTSDGKTTFSNDHSSRSSLRTDSNSSASCVDENKNEEKPPPPPPPHHVRVAANTPPPAPYSPMTQQYNKIITNSSSSLRSYPNSARYNNNNNYNHHYRQTYERNKTNDTTMLTRSKSNQNGSDVSPSNPNPSFESSVPQVHVAASQSFSQARRNRRSIRRSGSSGVNEIGAGDAPLPSEVGGEVVCKKLETLKL